MTYKENITAILECYFTGFKKEIIDSACNRILEQEPNCPFYKIDEDGHGLCKNNRYMEDVLGKIRAEIEKAVWEDVVVSLDMSDEVRIPRLDPDDVFEILDKYKAESDHKCHNCKHYTSGEQDGSCDSYICNGYSDWESEE